MIKRTLTGLAAAIFTVLVATAPAHAADVSGGETIGKPKPPECVWIWTATGSTCDWQ